MEQQLYFDVYYIIYTCIYVHVHVHVRSGVCVCMWKCTCSSGVRLDERFTLNVHMYSVHVWLLGWLPRKP